MDDDIYRENTVVKDVYVSNIPIVKNYISRYNFNVNLSDVEKMSLRLNDAKNSIFEKTNLDRTQIEEAYLSILETITNPFFTIERYIYKNCCMLILAMYCLQDSEHDLETINVRRLKDIQTRKHVIQKDLINDDIVSILRYIRLLINFSTYKQILASIIEE